MKLILASSSKSRYQSLSQFQLPFEAISPDIDESPRPQEDIETLISRLSLEKAQAVAKQHSEALIIASDALAMCDDKPIGKPGNRENAFRMLTSVSGKPVSFLTGLCLLHGPSGRYQYHLETTQVVFRQLSPTTIEQYLDKESPWHSACAFHAEGLGLALLEQFHCQDPSAILGLPLIKLTHFLINEGFPVL